MKLGSGHEVQEVEEEELAPLRRDWPGRIPKDVVRLTPGPWTFSTRFLEFADKYHTFQFHPSDVVISSFPKTGSTWVQEIVWTMRNNPDCDDNPQADLPAFLRVPHLELDIKTRRKLELETNSNDPIVRRFRQLCPGRSQSGGVGVQIAECSPQPRTIRTHLPLSLLPPTLLNTCKVVYVARNPKDVMVSLYHNHRLMKTHGYCGTWSDFVEYFINNKLLDYNYAESLRESWLERDHPNMHIVFYEDLKDDLMNELTRLNAFLGAELTQTRLENVARHTTFDAMKERAHKIYPGLENPLAINERVKAEEGGFFRKGLTGDWKDKFPSELLAEVEHWIDKEIRSLGVEFRCDV